MGSHWKVLVTVFYVSVAKWKTWIHACRTNSECNAHPVTNTESIIYSCDDTDNRSHNYSLCNVGYRHTRDIIER